MYLGEVSNTVQLAVSLAGLLSGLAAAVGALLLRGQVRQAKLQTSGDASRFCYVEMSALLGVLIDHPELRPFIYENTPCPVDGSLRQQVLALAGRYSDFFEMIHIQQASGNLSPADYAQVWKPFIEAILANSDVVRSYIGDHPRYFSEAIRVMSAGIHPPSIGQA